MNQETHDFAAKIILEWTIAEVWSWWSQNVWMKLRSKWEIENGEEEVPISNEDEKGEEIEEAAALPHLTTNNPNFKSFILITKEPTNNCKNGIR